MFGVLFVIVASIHVSTAVSIANAKANPIGKAVELLDVLKSQLESDMKADGDTYFEFSQWATNETTTAKQILLETKQSIVDLTTSIADEKAQREQMTQDHEKAVGELSQTERELANAKEVRNTERMEYENQEAIFVESIDQLTRSLEVLAKKFQDQPTVSLMAIATTLRSTLEKGEDLQLSASERETLDQFVRAAIKTRPQRSQQTVAPDFLQMKQQQDPNIEDDYGEYKTQSSGVVSTLEAVLEKTKNSRETANADEGKAQGAFEKLERQLGKQVEVAKERKADLESQISQSEERQAQMEADLLAAERLMKSTFEHLKAVQQDFTSKTRAYKERAIKRSDETIAVGEAIRVLTSETAKMLSSKQTIGTLDFLQLTRETRLKAVNVIGKTDNPGLVLLALRSHIRSQVWSASGDPFEKVKAMIRDMLERLETEANHEAEHHAWCTSEMEKTLKGQEDKRDDVQKLSDRIDASSNEIAKLKDEINQANLDLKDMRESLSSAARLRAEEETNAARSLKQYQDAQVLLGHAIRVLKQFYNTAAHDETANKDGSAEITGEENREGLGGGVVAILEIAEADFAELEKEAAAEEKKSAEIYKQMTNELQVQMAVFTKDVEYKTRNQIKLEASEARNSADRESYQKELSAIDDYMDKLKGDCIAKAEPYQERKAKREQELAALKDALGFLNGEALA